MFGVIVGIRVLFEFGGLFGFGLLFGFRGIV